MKFLGITFEPRSIVVGLHWTNERHVSSYDPDPDECSWINEVTLTLCLLPCLLIKFRIYYGESDQR